MFLFVDCEVLNVIEKYKAGHILISLKKKKAFVVSHDILVCEFLPPLSYPHGSLNGFNNSYMLMEVDFNISFWKCNI